MFEKDADFMKLLNQLLNRLSRGHKTNLDEIDLPPITFLARGAIVLLTPRDALLTSKMKNGTIIRGQNKQGYGGRGVFMFREAVEPELRLLDLILGPNDYFVDVGSCVGTYTVTAARLVGNGGVIAIDPNPEAAALLTKTVALNRMQNVLIVCSAAADQIGFTQFAVEEARPDTRGIEARPATGSEDLHRIVPTTTIDHIVFELDLPGRVRMMKIDAEGAESLVLNGAARTLERYKPMLILETAITDLPDLPGYIGHMAPGSRNSILVHEDDVNAIEKLNNDGIFAPI